MIRNSIPSLGTDANRIMLIRLSSMEGVNEVIFVMDGDSTPCPNDFGGFFFKHFYDAVDLYLFNLVHHFFVYGWTMQNFNLNIVAWIPKTPKANKMECFRPISMSNFKFKEISKKKKRQID